MKEYIIKILGTAEIEIWKGSNVKPSITNKDKLAESIVKLFTAPDVIGRSEQQTADKSQDQPQKKALIIGDVMASAFVVNVNQKNIGVIAKNQNEVFDILRAAGLDWKSISIKPLDEILPHLP